MIKIFCAIDDQMHSGWAASSAIEMARASSCALIFFMVNPAVLPGRGALILRWDETFINEYFMQARFRARTRGVYDVKCVTRNAIDITRAILLEGEIQNADYIVVGSNSRAGMMDNWKYSITRNIAARAHCPTVIVHSRLHLLAADIGNIAA